MSDIPLSEYRLLANNIIWYAVAAWWRVVGEIPYNTGRSDELNEFCIKQTAEEMGFSEPQEELLAFFVSDWFEELSYAAGLDWRAARRKLYGDIYQEER